MYLGDGESDSFSQKNEIQMSEKQYLSFYLHFFRSLSFSFCH